MQVSGDIGRERLTAVERAAHRLPQTVRPERYAIEFRPDLSRFTFSGEESISLRILRPTKAIVLNARQLTITHASIQHRGSPELPSDRIQLLEGPQRVKITWSQTLPPGSATLRLAFSGVLNDELTGFYRSRYLMSDGASGFMAATHFESTGARRAFPCWDEPSYKATFDVSLVVPEEMAAISNMPVAEEKDLGDGTRRVRFETTPRMTTYVVAFVVGPLQALAAHAKRGTTVSIWALPDRLDHGRWALDEGVRVLDYLDDYYGVPFPLPKLDHLSLQDFSAGAMENWGAITYRERFLLVDPSSSSSETKQLVTDTIAHETSHMWFGDLVTMAWWDDIWLNESFATWMAAKTMNALHPEWQTWTQFLSERTAYGLALDGLRNSHPIEVAVRDPAEIREVFDDISYHKGASVLRMLEAFLGEETFRRGIRHYLRTHRYGNARTDDLWRTLATASRKPVKAIMDSWTKQTGFPLLDAKVAREDGEAVLTIAQSRFLQTHILGPTRDATRWNVPVRVARAGSPKIASALLKTKTASYKLGRSRRPAREDWIKVNAGQSGFYRVNYAPEEWERLRTAMAAGELEASDRIGLLGDANDLMRAGYLPATQFLDLLRADRDEDTLTGWRIMAAALQDFESLIADEGYMNRFDAFGRDLFRAAGERLGWDARPGESHVDALTRTTVLLRLGHYGDREALDEAAERFEQSVHGNRVVPPDLREVVYNLVAQRADRATYDLLWDLEQKASLQEEQARLLVALGHPRDPALLRETLRRSLTDMVRVQDSNIVICCVAGTGPRFVTGRPGIGRPLAWAFVKENWDELRRRYTESAFFLRWLVEISQGFSTPEMSKDVEAFFRTQMAPEVARTVQQSIERIRVNAAWRKRNGKDVAAWFRSSQALE